MTLTMRLHDGKTLRNSGWLRESPRNLVPREWLAIKSRSALRKCMFLPAARGPAVDDAMRRAVIEPDVRPRASDDFGARVPRRIDPLRHARMMPAQLEPLTPRRAWAYPGDELAVPMNQSWLASPLALGLLMALLPPLGVAAVWASPRYDRDARWALTVTSALFMVMATVAVAMFLK